MAEIILAKTAGFCFGVTKAVDKVYETAAAVNGQIYTYGPIIHNEEVVKDLENHGVKAVDLEGALSLPKGSTIIIRSHGITLDEENALISSGLNVIDATCPFVKKIHRIVADAASEGQPVIIVGDPEHPEVKGIASRAGENSFIISEISDIEKLPKLDNPKVVSQTTFNYEKFQKIVENIRQNNYNTSVMNTICNATQDRQSEAAQIAGRVDAMVVVGGKHSSNTQKLFDICAGECKSTYFVQTAKELEGIVFPEVQSVGITAGASTPGNIIQEVLNYVRTKL